MGLAGIRRQVAGSGLTPATVELQPKFQSVRTYGGEEVSMLGAELSLDISEQLSLLMSDKRPYGGLDVFHVGDPLQKTPVKVCCQPKSSRARP